MQKAGFCISRRTVKCYFRRSNFPPHGIAAHVTIKGRRSPLKVSFGKAFLNQPTKK